MKKTIAEKWVKALRSGKYKQGQEVLHHKENDKNTYCCLGVLCDLYQQDRRSKKKKMLDVDNEYCTVTYDGADTLLPDVVREWAGMKTENGSWDDTNDTNANANLVYLNDEDRKTFKSLANVIEKNVENL
jgi:hypothetical protein